MADDRLIDEASAIADRRPVSTLSGSEGIRLLDQLGRLFGAAPVTRTESGDVLFLWGPLEVRRRLGAGSYGDVYEAWDPTLERVVALKLRSPEVGALRWLDEARNLARIRHSNVLTVHGADVLDGRAGIWTERIVGRTLEEELTSSGALAPEEVVRIGRDIASALSAVHAAGLLHGDVKPANIMLESGEAPQRTVLVDFGSADHAPASDEVPAYVLGTPLTMAPELLDGKPASSASDVYGLGATLFRLLTNQYPVEAGSLEELRRAHTNGTRLRVRALAPQASPRLARAVERALEPDPAQRWPSAKVFGRALDDVADPTRRIRARAAAIGGGAVGLAALSVLAWFLLHPVSGPIARGRLVPPSNPGEFREVWRQRGPVAKSGWGWVTAVADLNHDGFGDIVGVDVMWKGKDGRVCGRTMVYHGSKDGIDADLGAATEGMSAEAPIGMQLASAGDVNHDGFVDVLVQQNGEYSGNLNPHVWLFLGESENGTLTPAWTFSVDYRDAAIGGAMCSAGDVNGDGFGDVLINQALAPDSLRDDGIVYLFSGSRDGLSREPTWTVRGEQVGAALGVWMRRLGDVNADGFDDILLGAYMWDGAAVDCGQARVYLGGADGPEMKPVWTFDGDGLNSHLGNCVSGAGDINHDGYADAVIGEPQYSEEKRPERGRVLVFLGGPNGLSATPVWETKGPAAYAHCGYTVEGLGDVDGDGFSDFAVGTIQYTEGKRTHLGMVEVFRGTRTGVDSRPVWRAIGDADDCHFSRVMATGDVNGDQVPDLVVGSPLWSDAEATERGLIQVFLGRSGRR